MAGVGGDSGAGLEQEYVAANDVPGVDFQLTLGPHHAGPGAGEAA